MQFCFSEQDLMLRKWFYLFEYFKELTLINIKKAL